jgi:H+/gluconate symporter-like permease
MSSGGLDTLPHNGAVITLFLICGLTHRQSYKDLGMVTLVIPFTVVFLATIVLSVFVL